MSVRLQRLLLFAADARKLSSLVLRGVVAAKPATLAACGEATRRILLDSSRPPSSSNVAAAKLLELDREFNLVQYYGVQEYAKRWWSSTTFLSSISRNVGGKGHGNQQAPDEKKVARVAFMITSDQRHRLSTELGYTSQDIRSFKPIEALLLLEHRVKREADGLKDYDFRKRLEALVAENERLSTNQSDLNSERDGRGASAVCDEKGNDERPNHVSPEEAQEVHAKPDVAQALLVAEKSENDPGRGTVGTDAEPGVASSESGKSAEVRPTNDTGKLTPAIATRTDASATQSTPPPIDVTPRDSEELHMKPDVAAAILTSQRDAQREQRQELVDERDDEGDDGSCWYEVVERSAPGERAPNPAPNGRGTERVIALFPTKREALECARIKRSARSRDLRDDVGDGGDGSADRFGVRRRWNA